MNRKQKQMLKQQQTTRQLMGIRRLTPHGLTVGSEELIFFLIYPENLSVLSLDAIGQRVRAFTALLKANPDTELLALDAQETFQANREFYRTRLEEAGVLPYTAGGRDQSGPAGTAAAGFKPSGLRSVRRRYGAGICSR